MTRFVRLFLPCLSLPFLAVKSFLMPPHSTDPHLRPKVVSNGKRQRLVANGGAVVATTTYAADNKGVRLAASSSPSPSKPSTRNDDADNVDRTVTILQRGPRHIIALKPPSVVCHHSGWAGSRSAAKRGEEPEIPMLQRVRDALHDIDYNDNNDDDNDNNNGGGGSSSANTSAPVRKVNLVHRLDRGASGALLLTYAEDDGERSDGEGDGDSVDSRRDGKGDTAQLIEAMASPDSIKTYVALVRGEGVLRGEDLKQKGWFEVSRPIKDEGGDVAKDATTMFNFVAGQPESKGPPDRPRMSLVLARPKDGRWHQIRRHLNGLSHPILGDSTHGHSKTNGEWKRERNLPGERIALHLGRMSLVPTENIPEGIDARAPLMGDMLDMLRVYAPGVLERSLPVLEEEGIILEAEEGGYEVGRYSVPDSLSETTRNNKAFDDDDGGVDILERGENYVVVDKPPVVVVHHSSWTGKRSDPKRRWNQNNVPMLQRVRDETGRRVNLVHRLDRGASGCLLLSFAEDERDEQTGERAPCGVTRTLIESMRGPRSVKTYLALCDGDGTWNGVDYLERGWFDFDRPVKDEWGKPVEDARTEFRFVASTILPPTDKSGENATGDDGRENAEGRKVSIVLARPRTGRWHQIRQHLASGTIGHAILGDSSHGRSRTNRIWKKRRRMMKERTCLHLCRLRIPEALGPSTGDIDVTCPLPRDLRRMLEGMPEEGFLDGARSILAEEGIVI